MSYEQRDPNIAKTGFETSAESKLAENQIVDNSKSNQYSGVTAYSVKKSSTEPNPSSSVSYSDTSASFSSSTPGSDLYVQKEKQFDYSDDASKKTMMEKGKDLAANAKETAMNVGEKVKEKVSEGVAVAREKVNEGVSMAREKMDQMKSNKSGLSSSSDVIQDRMVVDDESRVELLHDNFANPDRSASEIKTEANQIFSEIKSDNYTSTQSPLLLKDDVSMSSKAGAKLDEAKLKAQELKLEGQAKAEELKAEGSMKLDEAKLKAQELKVVGQAKAEELKAEGAVKLDQAKVKATELKNVAMEKLSGATEIAKEKAIEAKDFAMEKLQEGKEMVQDYFQKNKSDNGEIMMKEDLVKQQPAYVTRTTVITESEPGFDKRTEVRKEINETAFIEGKRDTVASETGSKLDSTTA